MEVDAAVDVKGMIEQTRLPPAVIGDNVEEEVHEAFANADAIHEQYIDMGVEDVGEPEECRDDQPAADAATEGNDAQETSFDSNALEDSMEALYEGARFSKLAATVLLMNLCTVHGVTNQCANELFSILHLHILPERNTLPKSYHAAKSVTAKLGLTYNIIHACERGCVLFCGEHKDALRCLKCGGRRYKDEARRLFPLKVLRHFPIIPRLQRMYRSPAISKLLLWHAENRSNREGGDCLVRHPCDSKAWQHFHEMWTHHLQKTPNMFTSLLQLME